MKYFILFSAKVCREKPMCFKRVEYKTASKCSLETSGFRCAKIKINRKMYVSIPYSLVFSGDENT